MLGSQVSYVGGKSSVLYKYHNSRPASEPRQRHTPSRLFSSRGLLLAPSRAAIASHDRLWRRVIRPVSNCLLGEFRLRLFKTSPSLIGDKALTRRRSVGGYDCGAHADPKMDRVTVRQVGVDGKQEAGGRDGSKGRELDWRWTPFGLPISPRWAG